MFSTDLLFTIKRDAYIVKETGWFCRFPKHQKFDKWAMAAEKRQTCWPKLHTETEYESQLITILWNRNKNRYWWRGSALMPIEGLFLLLASIQAQIIVKGIRRNETATIETVRKKPLRHGCDWGDLVELSFVKQNVLQRRVSKLLKEPSYGRQNQTNRRYMFRKTSAIKSVKI